MTSCGNIMSDSNDCSVSGFTSATPIILGKRERLKTPMGKSARTFRRGTIFLDTQNERSARLKTNSIIVSWRVLISSPRRKDWHSIGREKSHLKQKSPRDGGVRIEPVERAEHLLVLLHDV